MKDLSLYTVHYTAVRISTSTAPIHVQTGARTIIAVNGNQAINSIRPALDDLYPESSGWRLELTARKIDDRIILELIQEWGWEPKEAA